MTFPLFSKLEDFAGLTNYEGIDVRPVLLRVLTDLYVQQPTHTIEEEKHFTELALRLIDVVDIPTKVDIARRIARFGAAPLPVVRRLASDLREIVDPLMVGRAPANSDELPTTAAEPAAPAAGAESAVDLAASDLGELFIAGNGAERRAILAEMTADDAAPSPALPRVQTTDICLRLEAAALQGRPHEFIREIERSLAIPRHQAERIVNDPSGEPVLVVAKALEMPIAILQRVLLLLNPAIGTSVRRVFDLSAFYQEISYESALRLVARWRDSGEPGADTHRPLPWTGETAGSSRDAPNAPRREIRPDSAGPRKRDQRAS